MIADTMRSSAEKLQATGMVSTATWEDLKVGGRVIIDQIEARIRNSDVVCLELSTLNANVYFELGLAIGANRRVWPLLDGADSEAKANWRRMKLLSTVGYIEYVKSDDVRAAFLRDLPHVEPTTLFERFVEPSLRPGLSSGVFYVMSSHPTDASSLAMKAIERQASKKGRLVKADPSEASVYPLSWYAQQIYASSATVVHLAAGRRVEADVHNARSSLVAGLAQGIGRPLLILAEEDFLAPIDYRDLVFNYETAQACANHVDRWLDQQTVGTTVEEEKSARSAQLALKTELRSFRFGEPVAENEAETLQDYFVETAQFDDIIANRSTVFVGRKGSGKTANFFQAARSLHGDARVLTVIIKPGAPEFGAATSMLTRYRAADHRNYFIESLWQYLLYTEITKAAIAEIRRKPVGPAPESPEWHLVRYGEDEALGLHSDFGIRLEKALGVLAESGTDLTQEERAEATQRLHSGPLRDMRVKLGEAVQDYDRVAIMIDNLDKAWESGGDLDAQAHLLLGLLSAVGKLDVDFGRKDGWRKPIALTLAVFLRSDIYASIVERAREPDKISVSRIVWSEQNLLLRIIERRWLASQSQEVAAHDLWSRFFAPEVAGQPTSEWILEQILPRPRDMIYFCNAAVTAAINSGHPIVEEDDLRSAARFYSAFAFESLVVEFRPTLPEIETVLVEFAGLTPVVTTLDVDRALDQANVPSNSKAAILDRLLASSFLGRETAEDYYQYADEVSDFRVTEKVAERVRERRSLPARFQIHPAFRPYLEIA